MSEVKRYDVLILSTNRGFRMTPRGAHAIIMNLSLSGKAKPYEEAVAKTWTEVYMKAGPSTSEIFTKLGYSGEHPIFEEAAFFFSTDKPVDLEYGPTDRLVHWYMEFRGCTFKAPYGRFRKLFLNAFNIRIEAYFRDFSGELPPHREVAEDELPEDEALLRRQEKDRSAGKMGTEVHEF